MQIEISVQDPLTRCQPGLFSACFEFDSAPRFDQDQIMPATTAAYNKLVKRVRGITLLSSANELLSWDQETYMPPKALDFRAEQMALLSGEAHRLFISRKVGDLISECEQQGLPAGSPEAANLREWRRQFNRKTKIPARLIEKFTRIRAHAREAWREARQQSKFRLFRPHLQKLVDLQIRFVDLWGYSGSPYDALLDEYEPGASAEELQKLFAELRPAIVALLGPAVTRSAATPRSILNGHYPIPAQQSLNREVAEAMGYDFGAGRIDTTTHPFCTTLGPRDCRLTTRYDEQDFTCSLYSVMHEAGHGLYEQGLPQSFFGEPAGSAASLGIHESQSRLWENHIGRSAAFWEFWHPRACRHFTDLARLTPTQVAAAVNHVEPSFIRVEADQVTYDLHIILRFEIELRLITRELAVADVPAFWNEQFEKSLGLKVTRDSDGCLQDVHWSLGSMGYFPTYTLGNLNAAQLMHAARVANPALDGALARGEYGSLLAWLRENVHRHGLQLQPQDLMRRATGAPTTATYHLESLRKKFL